MIEVGLILSNIYLFTLRGLVLEVWCGSFFCIPYTQTFVHE